MKCEIWHILCLSSRQFCGTKSTDGFDNDRRFWVLLLWTACHTTVGLHCHLVTFCVISHHRSGNVFVQLSSVFVWQWLSCTVILSRVQTRQVQGHHAAGIVSGDLYVSLDTLSIDGATSIIRYNPHPLHCFPRRLPGPLHVVASKSKPRSFTGETETFTRLLQPCTGGNGLQYFDFSTLMNTERMKIIQTIFKHQSKKIFAIQKHWQCILVRSSISESVSFILWVLMGTQLQLTVLQLHLSTGWTPSTEFA